MSLLTYHCRTKFYSKWTLIYEITWYDTGVYIYLNINRISANANRTLGFLKRNIKTKHTCIRTAAYTTVVRLKVEYAYSVWSPYTRVSINNQWRAVRWTIKNYSSYATVTQMQNNLGWRTLMDKRVDARLILFYRIV